MFPGQRIPAGPHRPAATKMKRLVTPRRILSTVPSANNYNAVGSYEFNRDNFDFKVNYNPTEKSSLLRGTVFRPARFSTRRRSARPAATRLTGGQPGNAPGRIHSLRCGGTYTVSPRVWSTPLIGYTRFDSARRTSDIDKNYGLDDLQIPGTNGADRLQGGYPRFVITGMSSIGNPNVSNPFLFRDNQTLRNANIGYVRGAHSFRFGGEYTRYDINHFQPQAAFGPPRRL
jgi:hypothetical protein